MKRYIQDKGKSDCGAVTYPGGLFTLWAVADATLSFLVPAGITAILSALLKVRRIWCIREDSNLRPLGS
ncbi:hypothetical protein, partial [Salmonella enterica]